VDKKLDQATVVTFEVFMTRNKVLGYATNRKVAIEN
jgi:hypothetical protein